MDKGVKMGIRGVKYFFAKVKYKLFGSNDEIISSYFRKQGIEVGQDCHIYSDITTSESYLIHIGNNVTISNDVQFLTHDNSICKVLPEFTDLFGEIVIGNNCFIGSHAIMLPGVHLADNIIVAAGSVVTKSFCDEKIIIGGVPARVIGNWESFKERYRRAAINIDDLSANEKKKVIIENSEMIKK